MRYLFTLIMGFLFFHLKQLQLIIFTDKKLTADHIKLKDHFKGYRMYVQYVTEPICIILTHIKFMNTHNEFKFVHSPFVFKNH